MNDSTRWTEEEMFATNSKLQGGRICEYDGNPHAFAEKGFDGFDTSERVDPHAFRVVGGSFMNSQKGLENVSNDQAQSNYQPLVRDVEASVNAQSVQTNNSIGGGGLQPFFSQEGVTPWGEVVDEAKSDDGDDDMLYKDDEEEEEPFHSIGAYKGQKKILQKDTTVEAGGVSGDYDYNNDDGMMIFATDKEITAKKQRDHELQKKNKTSASSKEKARRLHKEKLIAQTNANMRYVYDYIASLPTPVNFTIPTETVDAIIDKHYGKGAAAAADRARKEVFAATGG